MSRCTVSWIVYFCKLEIDYNSSSQLMRIAAVLAATLHNIHESARFKTGAFRFWGCLPVPESSAAEQKMQECLKVRLALEPLTCIRLA